MRHHTKDKADVAVAKVIADMSAKGYSMFIPISEHLPFDLVVYGKILLRVQVKYRSAGVSDRVLLDIRQRWSDSNGSYSRNADKSEVDLYVLFCPEVDRCFYIWDNEFTQRKTIRLNSEQYNLASLV